MSHGILLYIIYVYRHDCSLEIIADSLEGKYTNIDTVGTLREF